MRYVNIGKHRNYLLLPRGQTQTNNNRQVSTAIVEKIIAPNREEYISSQEKKGKIQEY